MKNRSSFALSALLLASALAGPPLLAQEAQPAPEDEASEQAPPADDSAPAEAEAEEPRVVTVAPPAPAAEAEPAEEAAPRPARRAPAAAPARTVAPRRAPAPSGTRAPAPIAAAPVSPLPVTDPSAALPAPVAIEPAPVAADPAAATSAPTSVPPAAEEEDGGSDNGPLLLLGALALLGAAAAFLMARRRRNARVEHHEHPAYEAPAAAPVAAPAAAAPIAAAAAPAAAPGFGGRPWLELLMRPVRAGVGEEDARVEFELRVDNRGSAPATDVRISTFMLAAGSGEASEAERALLETPAEARLPESIDPGDGRRIAGAVALPRGGLHDSILPVVVADARYRLPDGSEGRTLASYAVGVPWGEELAHFDVANPSGLHEGVEARLRGEPTRT